MLFIPSHQFRLGTRVRWKEAGQYCVPSQYRQQNGYLGFQAGNDGAVLIPSSGLFDASQVSCRKCCTEDELLHQQAQVQLHQNEIIQAVCFGSRSHDRGSLRKMQRNVELCVGRLKRRQLNTLRKARYTHLPWNRLEACFGLCTGDGEKDLEFLLISMTFDAVSFL